MNTMTNYDSIDDALVEPDDDFGFNGMLEQFSDSRSYSPTQQKDI